jgi:hypothetical protein
MKGNRTFCQLDTDCTDWIADGCLERMWKHKMRLDYEKIAAAFPRGKPVAGVYCIWESTGGRSRPIYVGESDNLRRRIQQLHRLTKHTFARKFAVRRARKVKFRPTKEVVLRFSKRRTDEIEMNLAERYAKQLRLGWTETTFGRREIEESLVRRYAPPFNEANRG